MKTEENSKPGLAILLLVLLALNILARHNIFEKSLTFITPPENPGVCGTTDIDYIHVSASDAYSDRGEKLFKQNCAVCHSMGTNKVTGPGLKGIITRVPSEEWLEAYISNNDSVYKSGDAYAAKLKRENTADMTIFTHLSKEEIQEIIRFMKDYHPTYIAREIVP
jgi:cytochrome c2